MSDEARRVFLTDLANDVAAHIARRQGRFVLGDRVTMHGDIGEVVGTRDDGASALVEWDSYDDDPPQSWHPASSLTFLEDR